MLFQMTFETGFSGLYIRISHSLSHESDDHRLVDLCTALEILLIPEGRREPSKGTVIALRYKLLGGHLNASAIKWLYDRRNDVIHGGPVARNRAAGHMGTKGWSAVRPFAKSSIPPAISPACLPSKN